jgi:hypothetical protein
VNGLWRKIRKHYGKERHQFLTVSEFCQYMKISEDEVYEALGD